VKYSSITIPVLALAALGASACAPSPPMVVEVAAPAAQPYQVAPAPVAPADPPGEDIAGQPETGTDGAASSLMSRRAADGQLVVSMRPIANPDDMDDAARRQYYGSRYLRSAPCAGQRPTPVSVLFGTDRERDESAVGGFGGRRGSRLVLGEATVTIPPCHRSGVTERPFVVGTISLPERPGKHIVLQGPPEIMTEAQFVAAAKRDAKPGAVLFIHGFNTPFASGLYRAAQLSYDLGMEGAVFHFSWPAPPGPSTYAYARDSTDMAEADLRIFIETIARKAGVSKISIVAHSMGNQLLLGTLARWDGLPRTLGPHPFGQLIMAAPDVDMDLGRQWLETAGTYFDGATVYANSRDLAIGVSDRVSGAPRLGDLSSTGWPAIISGVDSIDASAASFDFLALNHDTYIDDDDVRADLTALIRTGVRPPHCRSDRLEPVPAGGSQFWRLLPKGELAGNLLSARTRCPNRSVEAGPR